VNPLATLFCTADTTAGKVRGLVNSGICQFKGVPYGASTAGAQRFMPPRKPLPWREVLDCVGYAPVCPQTPSARDNDYARLIQFDLNHAFGGMSEDCLHLSIWTPGLADGVRRPVLVQFHGGGFAIGSANVPLYDGARLAALGDVVVVAVTHRLASLGFLNLLDVGAPGEFSAAGVAGLMDLIAALEWVRDNIVAFGGDPTQVMIFGQSGGGWKVSALLAAPSAQGLFHRAAIQSGSLIHHQTREASARTAAAFIERLGVSPSDIIKLQTLPFEQLLAAQTEIGVAAFAPVLDGACLPTHPFEPTAPEMSSRIPLIISTTLDDAGLFYADFDLSDEQLKTRLRAAYGDAAGPLLALYRQHWPDKTPFLLHAQIVTDASFRFWAYTQAERKAAQGAAPVYMYLWEWPSPAFDGKFGAAHGIDVAASLNNEHNAIIGGGSSEARERCRALSEAWIAFARTGNPNHAGLPHWPAFETTNRATLVLGVEHQIVSDPYNDIRLAWRDILRP
jgi:para-nitrobenzyl esterase